MSYEVTDQEAIDYFKGALIIRKIEGEKQVKIAERDVLLAEEDNKLSQTIEQAQQATVLVRGEITAQYDKILSDLDALKPIIK